MAGAEAQPPHAVAGRCALYALPLLPPLPLPASAGASALPFGCGVIYNAFQGW